MTRMMHACSRLLLACVGLVAFSHTALLSQQPEVPLLPVYESPLLLSVPKAPVDENTSGVATLAPSVPFSSKTPSSTSASRQFTVYGGDLSLRSAFCLLCEETAAALGRVLKDNGKFALPVVVVLKLPPDITAAGPAVTLSIGELVHGGFHLQINAQLRTGFRTEDFTRELVCVLLAERILRSHQKLNTSRQKDVLPAWLMTGVSQAMDYRSRWKPSALFSAVFRRGQVYSLDRILAADPAQLDALSRGIYETSTCALVLTLLDQPDGSLRFSKFLSALAVENRSDRDLLMQHFPNLAASKNALEKWWSLQMASLATPTAMETLTVAQTEEELDEALMLAIPVAAARKEAAPKPAAPAPEPAAEEKKRGGILGLFRRGDKDGDPKDKEEKGDSKSKSDPAPPASEEKASDKKEEPKSVSAAFGFELSPAGLPFFLLPELLMSFHHEGREVAFPFGKKKEEEPAEEKDKAKAKKPAATESKPAKSEPQKPPPAAPAKAKSEEAPVELSRKPGQNRSVGVRPGELPKAPPPVAPKPAEAPPAEPPKKAAKEDKPADDAAEPETRSKLNPLNWFRKDSEPPAGGAVAEASTAASSKKRAASSDASPAPATQSKPAPAARSYKAGSIPLEDFALIAKRSDRADIFNRCITRLSTLKLRAHPLYKPLIADYTAVVQEMMEGKTKGAAGKLEELRQQREAVHTKALAVESHLDWYEANHTGTLSHAFDDFLRLEEELNKERLPRNDSLSKYLDSVQKEFEGR